MSWILLAIFTYVLFALGNIFEKILRMSYLKSLFTLFFIGGIPSVLLLFIPLFTNIELNANPFIIALAIFSGILGYAAFFPYLIALKREEVSRLVPLWNNTSLLTLLLAFFILQERLPPNFYLAFGLIFFGSLLISIKDFSRKFSSYGFFMMLCSSLIYSIDLVILKYVLNFVNILSVIFYSSVGSTLVLLILFLLKDLRTGILYDLNKIQQKHILVAYMFVITIAVFPYFYSIQQGPVSIITVLGGFQAVSVFLLAIIFSFLFPHLLKEEIKFETLAIKVVSIALMIAGLYFLQS